MAVVRELVATFGLETDPRGFNRAEKAIDGVVKGAKILGGLFVGGVVSLGFKNLIDLASESTETANKFGAVFGDAAENVQKQIDAIAKRTGQANLEITQFTSNIGALVRPALGSAEAAGKVATRITELALDVASFNDVRPQEALIALRSGLIGSAEPLQRFGVDVRVAALEQEALRQGLDSNVQAMTEGQRVALRLVAIQRQLGSQGATGDATRTAEEFANASRALRGNLRELGADIGKFLLPGATKLVLEFLDLVRNTKSYIRENRELIGQSIGGFFEGAATVIGSVVRSLVAVTKATSDWLADLDPVSKTILKVTAGILALIAILAIPAGPLLFLISLVGLLIEDFEVWRKGGVSVIGALIREFNEFIDRWPILGAAIDLASQAWDVLKENAMVAFDFVAGLFSDFLSDSDETTTKVGASFESVFGGLKDLIADIDFGGIADSIKDFAKKAGVVLGQFLQTTPGQILTSLLGASIGADIGTALGEGLGGLAGRFLGKSRVPGSKAIGEFLGKQLGGIGGKVLGSVAGGVAGAGFAGGIGEQLINLSGGPAGAIGPTAASLTDNSSTSNTFNITQQPGENGEDFAQRVIELQSEAMATQARSAQESFVTTAPATTP